MRLYKAYKQPTVLHFDNGGKYGIDFKEAQVWYEQGLFRVVFTDGYKWIGPHFMRFSTLKNAVAFGKEELNNN